MKLLILFTLLFSISSWAEDPSPSSPTENLNPPSQQTCDATANGARVDQSVISSDGTPTDTGSADRSANQ